MTLILRTIPVLLTEDFHSTIFRRFVTDGNGHMIHGSQLVTRISSLNEISDVTLRNMESSRKNEQILYGFQRDDDPAAARDPNLIVHQVGNYFTFPIYTLNLHFESDCKLTYFKVHVKAPFTTEVVFESATFFNRPSTLAGDVYSETLEDYR